MAHFPPGPAFLALRAGVPLFVGFELPSEGTSASLAHIGLPLRIERSGDLDHDVQRLTQLIANEFERHIRRAPGRWVMFHDIWRNDVSEFGSAHTFAAAASP
jgi:lauroyl/myristoyl acyltransferase